MKDEVIEYECPFCKTNMVTEGLEITANGTYGVVDSFQVVNPNKGFMQIEYLCKIFIDTCYYCPNCGFIAYFTPSSRLSEVNDAIDQRKAYEKANIKSSSKNKKGRALWKDKL